MIGAAAAHLRALDRGGRGAQRGAAAARHGGPGGAGLQPLQGDTWRGHMNQFYLFPCSGT